jgi:hypothetical protein
MKTYGHLRDEHKLELCCDKKKTKGNQEMESYRTCRAIAGRRNERKAIAENPEKMSNMMPTKENGY